MSDIDQEEPMDASAKKFLEAVFRDVAVEGIIRRLEFRDDGDGYTAVKLVAPNHVLPTIALGFPAGWEPPSAEEWDESVGDELLGWLADPNRPGIPSEMKREEDRRKLEAERKLRDQCPTCGGGLCSCGMCHNTRTDCRDFSSQCGNDV